MESSKKSLCVFIHFSFSKYIPYYVLLYLKELTIYFDEIVLVTNKRPINNDHLLPHPKVKSMLVENEGYDFGMFYKVYQTLELSDYRQIACINDSNILFNKLTTIFSWGEAANLDLWGLIDSTQKPHLPIPDGEYHIQSHFLVFNERAVKLLPEFFNSIDIERILKENDIYTVRQFVIIYWEIGISQYMLKKGLRIGSYINGKMFSNLYIPGKERNISRRLYPQLIESGYPLLKKRVIFDSKLDHILRFHPSWKKLLRRYGNKEWEIEKLVKEMSELKNNETDRPRQK